MDWKKLEKKYDNKDVLGWMRSFSDQIIEAVYYGKKLKVKKKKIDRIVACGMGGSGIGAGILRNLVKDELKVPFETFSSYDIPAYVNSRTLVFCVSFSGNTEETLSCFKQAKEKRAYIIALTTGGKLQKMANANDTIIFPKNSPQPRMTLAYLCLPLPIVLEKLRLIEKKNNHLNEAVFLLKKEQMNIEAKAKDIALKIKGKLPIIYGSEELSTTTYRFRTELNERSEERRVGKECRSRWSPYH